MFGFKSKRYKKLERINEMLEMELQRLNAMRISAYEKTLHATEKRVIPLHCSVTVDTIGYYSTENIIKYAEKEVLQHLADDIGEYVTFEVRELDRFDANDMDGNPLAVTKFEVIGKVEVVEK